MLLSKLRIVWTAFELSVELLKDMIVMMCQEGTNPVWFKSLPTLRSNQSKNLITRHPPIDVLCYFDLTRSKHVWQLTCMQKWTWKDTCVSLILAQYSLSITDHRCTSAIFNTAKSYHRLAQIQIWERAKVYVVWYWLLRLTTELKSEHTCCGCNLNVFPIAG